MGAVESNEEVWNSILSVLHTLASGKDNAFRIAIGQLRMAVEVSHGQTSHLVRQHFRMWRVGILVAA